jgi:hypothetical protein
VADKIEALDTYINRYQWQRWKYHRWQ